MKNKVHEKGYRNRPLTEEQKANNTKKSKIRARIEHVFGFLEQSMNDLVLKSVGMVRAIALVYEDIDTNGAYDIRVTGYRVDQIQINGEWVKPFVFSDQKGAIIE